MFSVPTYQQLGERFLAGAGREERVRPHVGAVAAERVEVGVEHAELTDGLLSAAVAGVQDVADAWEETNVRLRTVKNER